MEKDGEPFGAWGVMPFSATSPRAWVWFRIQNSKKALRMLPSLARMYFAGLLESRFTDLYATIRNEPSERFVKHFGFERDKDFEMRYNVSEVKIYRKSRRGV